MKNLTPRKRVGHPAAFLGVRGDYLTSLMIYCASFLFFMLFIITIPMGSMEYIIKPTIAALCLIYLRYHKYEDLKEKSKGDIYHTLKKNCKKKLIVRSKNDNESFNSFY